jgi:hypothetical protein
MKTKINIKIMAENNQSDSKITSNTKTLYINGKPMPFTAEELKKILFVIKSSLSKAEEQLLNKGEEKAIDHLLEGLDDV